MHPANRLASDAWYSRKAKTGCFRSLASLKQELAGTTSGQLFFRRSELIESARGRNQTIILTRPARRGRPSSRTADLTAGNFVTMRLHFVATTIAVIADRDDSPAVNRKRLSSRLKLRVFP